MSDQMLGIICFVAGFVVGSVAEHIYAIKRTMWLHRKAIETYLDTKLAQRDNTTEADNAE